MKIKKYKGYFHDELKEIYSRQEREALYKRWMTAVLNLSSLALVLEEERELTPEEYELLTAGLERLKKQEPLQYIIGYADFFGLRFKVNSQVLIPRPETEELVAWIVENHKEKPITILDIGTGSGCIAVALAKNLPESRVTAWDVSAEALAVAAINARDNQVKVNFARRDILKTEEPEGHWEVWVSNPPYIRKEERQKMQSNVLDYEPHLALFVEDADPLLFYRKIISLALNKGDEKICLYFELNEYLQEDLEEMLMQYGLKQYEFKKDIFGKVRMLKITLQK